MAPGSGRGALADRSQQPPGASCDPGAQPSAWLGVVAANAEPAPTLAEVLLREVAQRQSVPKAGDAMGLMGRLCPAGWASQSCDTARGRPQRCKSSLAGTRDGPGCPECYLVGSEAQRGSVACPRSHGL